MVEISWVFCQVFRTSDGRLTVGGTHNHLFDGSFYIPSMIHKIFGKPGEQIGMSWPASLGSKVTWSGYQGATKNGLPVSVDRDP